MADASSQIVSEVDVVVLGGGISGVSMAYHLKTKCPDKTFAVLEGRGEIGGTWSLFQYPGIRSDSDMHTFGFGWKPWNKTSVISPGADIMAYLKEAVVEHELDQYIHMGKHVATAAFDSTTNKWTLTTRDGMQYVCRWLHMATGYYRYDEGYTPEWDGVEQFKGEIVHPQKWTDDIAYQGKKVVIIGSGATAVTLVPSLVEGGAEHVTMLQRSPGYYFSLPGKGDIIDHAITKILPERLSHWVVRMKYIVFQQAQFMFAKTLPKVTKWIFAAQTKLLTPRGFDIATHFTPTYNVWDERVCVVPDADFFRCLGTEKATDAKQTRKRAEVVTDHIDKFTEAGIMLKSGHELEADLIVTATGLNLLNNFPCNAMDITVDGVPYDAPQAMVHRGVMISDVPCMSFTVGYANASWTLRADIISSYVCRLLSYMDTKQYTSCVAERGDTKPEDAPFLGLQSGYLRRAAARMPGQTRTGEWAMDQSLAKDLLKLKLKRDAKLFEDCALKFS
mmetsp:Transcript_9884/g.23281  ORF Transcript_9884/g.23281 Transcript_9884/m.23281 type:complete len:504 (+) Transcript_9884:176-1687(+)|eukprot:CAMPEP_0182565048 /NCGR_PEP_ID=MMETSP1324-20130603/6853_1 /TAXON_ID=236786 /ORGANISM="Florenciella sp., Strain RCC1587" /LENGTH=503 /DNA_ID=CAMNT_0024778633 /DNA_START=147 /DNA_END=1658 /DNA_ORIENTATION=-